MSKRLSAACPFCLTQASTASILVVAVTLVASTITASCLTNSTCHAAHALTLLSEALPRAALGRCGDGGGGVKLRKTAGRQTRRAGAAACDIANEFRRRWLRLPRVAPEGGRTSCERGAGHSRGTWEAILRACRSSLSRSLSDVIAPARHFCAATRVTLAKLVCATSTS